MIVGVPATRDGDPRVAMVPAVAAKLRDRGLDVHVAAGAGADAGFGDDDYRAVGCTVADDRATILEAADVVLQIDGLTATDRYRDDQIVIGLLDPYDLEAPVLEALLDRRTSAFALELLPRLSRAQSMDALTSMASVAGYKAAVTAADRLPKQFPLQMTAAGTIRPAAVFVVGAGVAGLQAIATAKRLGARVRAYDIRPAVKEEVESLGATFLELGLETEAAATAGGYAREQDPAFLDRQREAMTDAVAAADVLVTAAAVPGRPAPTLVTAEMVAGMASGSVVVDLGAAGGGNCEPTVPGETVVYEDVTVMGPTNLPATVPGTASQLVATNLANFLTYLLDDADLAVGEDGIAVDTDDEIVDATLIAHAGHGRHPSAEVPADGE